MTALHWICVVTLALICRLTAFPLSYEFPEIISYVEEFSSKVQELACLDSGAAYYSPVNVKDNCLTSALNCSIIELEKLVNNCTPVPENDISDNLLTSLYDIQDAGPSCSKDEFFCNNFDKKNYKDFLEDIITLLQQMSSQSQYRRR